MDFLVVKDPQQYEKDTVYNSIKLTITDRNGVLFKQEMTDFPDTIDTWFGMLRLLDTVGSKQLGDLLDAIPDLLRATVSNNCHDTYFNLLHAIFKWLREERDIEDQSQRWYALFNELEQALFRFTISEPVRGFYLAVFSCNSEEKLKVLIPLREFRDSPIPVCQIIMARAYQERKVDSLYFINNYQHFHLNVARLNQGTEEGRRTAQTFVSLSKALIILIKQGVADLGIYESLIPEICTFIVKRETDIEEQKRYLEYILESREDENAKTQRLDEIIAACCAQQGTDETRLMQVISIISDHYLRLYDFKRSDHFWRKVRTNDFLLKLLLSFHKHPLHYLLIQIGMLILLFAIVWLPSVFHWQIPTSLSGGLLPTTLSYIPPLLILIAVGFVVLSAVLKSKRWLYSQLLLPRLVGAAIVGMFPLLFNSQSWLLGLQSRPIPWLLLLLLTYISSFAYMFIEVYKTMKFVKGRSLEEALRTSVKIFCIAACETLVIITVTSMFVFPSIAQSLVNLNTDAPGISVDLPPFLSFNLFPSLILLWGGFALFIGSFVQLLWQDRRITDPI